MNHKSDDNTHQLLLMITKYTFATGIVFAFIGIVLLVLEGTGQNSIDLFGTDISTKNAGLGAMFMAVVMIMTTMKRILKLLSEKKS